MGAYQAGNDPNIDEALAQWPIMVEYLKQKPRELVNFQQSTSDLFGLFEP
jgi:flagellar biosynthesis/type III secretory pathway ATPase